MTTSTGTIRIEVAGRPDDAYALLTDLDGLGRWLPRSSVYRGTTRGTPGGYVDHTPLGDLHGAIVGADAPHRIVYDQATTNGALRIRIEYVLRARGAATVIERTGAITTAGWLRPLHPLIVAVTHRENRRTLDRLATVLDSTSPDHHPPRTTHSHHRRKETRL